MKKSSKSGGSSSLVKYEDYSAEDATEDAKQKKKEGGAGKYLRLASGKNILRFLPALQGKKWKRVGYKHYLDIPGVGKIQFWCPRTERKAFCRCCTEQQKLLATGNDIDEKKAYKLKAKRRCLSNVVDRSDEEFGVKVLEYGAMIEDRLIAIRQDEDDGGNFLDPVGGFDISITMSGEGFETKYTTNPAFKGKVKPLHEDTKRLNELLQMQRDLDREIKVYNPDEMEELFETGKAPQGRSKKSRDEDEDEEDYTRKSSRGIDDEIEGVVLDDEDD